MKIYFIILASIFMTSCHSMNEEANKDSLLGNDYRLFQHTPVWELAKAIKMGDVNEIKKIVSEQKVNINYQESRFGSTLLMLTIINEQYSTFKTLLEMGADPNIHDTYDGASALIYASGIENDTINQINYLKLLLINGANPNDQEVGRRREGNSTRNTPLLVACADVNLLKSPIYKVKVLVEAGANVNYKNEFNDFPLAEALIHKHYDVVLYLLNNNANYLEMIFDRSEFSADGKKIYIADFLREELFSLDSKEYKQKMEVVAFLKQKGIDYRKVKIPSYIVDEVKKTYPKNWKEYLEKY